MTRALVGLVVALGLVVPATASAQDPALTPDGPATLVDWSSGGSTLEGHTTRVLVAWKVTVGPGGRAGTVRPRFTSKSSGPVLGDPVQLPAEPGTYLYPAPQLPEGDLTGLDQFTGGHAIARRDHCERENGTDPSCSFWSVQVFKGDPPPGPRPAADETIDGAQLAIEPLYENDGDGDGVADISSDRTDLSVSLSKSVDVKGDIRVAVNVTNHGPRTADLPGVAMTFPANTIVHWDKDCFTNLPMAMAHLAPGSSCALPAIAAGATQTTWFTLPNGSATFSARVFAEGPDLAPADNTATLAAPQAVPMKLDAAAKQHLAKGIKVTLTSARPHGIDVRVIFKVHGRSLTLSRRITVAAATPKTVTLRPHGAQLRSLRRAVAHGTLRGKVIVADHDLIYQPVREVRLAR